MPKRTARYNTTQPTTTVPSSYFGGVHTSYRRTTSRHRTSHRHRMNGSGRRHSRRHSRRHRYRY